MRVTLVGGDTLRTACYFTALSRRPELKVEVILYGPLQPRDIESIPESIFSELDSVDREFVTGPWLRPRRSRSRSRCLELTESSSIGAADTIAAIELVDPEIIVYSGLPAELVPATVTDRFHVLHAHPGRLPRFRGSTTIYWSLLEDQRPACTVIRLNSRIDQGPILTSRDFDLPQLDAGQIDKYFDPMIRAATLVTALQQHQTGSELTYNDTAQGRDYFVIHPVLKALALGVHNRSRQL